MLLTGTLLMGFWLFLVGGLQARFGHWGELNGNSKFQNLTDVFFQNARKGVWAITDNSAATRAVIVCSYLFVCSFAITMGPVSWTYPAELVRDSSFTLTLSLEET